MLSAKNEVDRAKNQVKLTESGRDTSPSTKLAKLKMEPVYNADAPSVTLAEKPSASPNCLSATKRSQRSQRSQRSKRTQLSKRP